VISDVVVEFLPPESSWKDFLRRAASLTNGVTENAAFYQAADNRFRYITARNFRCADAPQSNRLKRHRRNPFSACVNKNSGLRPELRIPPTIDAVNRRAGNQFVRISARKSKKTLLLLLWTTVPKRSGNERAAGKSKRKIDDEEFVFACVINEFGYKSRLTPCAIWHRSDDISQVRQFASMTIASPSP